MNLWIKNIIAFLVIYVIIMMIFALIISGYMSNIDNPQSESDLTRASFADKFKALYGDGKIYKLNSGDISDITKNMTIASHTIAVLLCMSVFIF